MQLCGNFEGFPVQQCIVWVGNITTPVFDSSFSFILSLPKTGSSLIRFYTLLLEYHPTDHLQHYHQLMLVNNKS